MKARVIMLVRNVSTVCSELLAILEPPTQEMETLRPRLTEHGRFPSRRTREHWLTSLPHPIE